MLSPYVPVSAVRMSVAVWAMSGVCSFVSSVPWPFMKFSRAGICCRSDGTFGLSRVKWVLSKTTLTTCWTPFPRSQLLCADLFGSSFARVAAGAATCQPMATAATTTSLISRFIPFPLLKNADETRDGEGSHRHDKTVIAPRYLEVITGLGIFHLPARRGGQPVRAGWGVAVFTSPLAGEVGPLGPG